MKTKKIFLSIAFLMSVFFFKAQDKYEFMIIEYNTVDYDLITSIDGLQFMREKADFTSQQKSGFNANPFLIKVKEYQDKGWEVISFNSGITSSNYKEVHFAHLRKKKK